MRRIFAGLTTVVSVALLATACNLSNDSITAPSPVTGLGSLDSNTIGTTATPTFTATPLDGGTWVGTTTPASLPSTGHNGNLSIVFAGPFVGTRLSWTGFGAGGSDNPGNPHAVCSISNDRDSEVLILPDCRDGSIDVFPTVPTLYTFTDTKNPEQSHDKPIVATVPVNFPDSLNITARWNSMLGPGDDDAGLIYTGTASGPSICLQVDATSNTQCGLSGNRTNPANHFHATLTVVDRTHITGTYDGVACTVDRGSFSLTKQ